MSGESAAAVQALAAQLPAGDDAPPASAATVRNGLGRIRTGLRLACTGLHLARGLATVAWVFPLITPQRQRRMKQRWSAQLLQGLGVRLAHDVPPLRGKLLLVANHVSWLDIFVINAVAPAAFVAKRDVADWPVIGWLCARTETLFLERGNRNAAHRAQQGIADTLAAERLVAVFPEGTTSEGASVLPFHAALLQPAIDARADVVALALRYCDGDGKQTPVPAYAGDTTLWQSLKAIAAADGLSAYLQLATRVGTDALPARGGRRALAERLRTAIAESLA